MNDNEIIKALGNCLGNKMHKCSGCRFISEGAFCENVLLKHTLDLINRLQAENERLKRTPKCVYAYDGETMEYCVEGPCSAEKTIETIESEARKEFAKRLKENFDTYTDDEEWQVLNIKNLANNLLEEMEKEV